MNHSAHLDPRIRVRAARALKIIDAIKQRAQKEKLSVERVIVEAWDEKPQSAES